MPEPIKSESTKAKRAEDPRVAAARQRMASITAGPSGAQKPPSQFFKETWRELKLTTWPDRQTLIKSTYVVLTFIVVTALFTFGFYLLLDQATAWLVRP
jgi:preprotein translocase SecE subunit